MEYVIKEKNIHFYYRKNMGLVMKKGHEPPFIVHRNVSENFCVYAIGGGIHIICVSDKNELLYTSESKDGFNTCVLCTLPKGVCVKNILTGKSDNGENLLFSAEHNGKIMLVHCVLGNNAMPSVIDRLMSDYFFVYGSRVYYTNSVGIMGYQEFSDGKPDRFVRMEDGVEDVYLCRLGGKEYSVFKKSDTVFVNNVPILEDIDVSCPIIAYRDKIILMWKSGAIVKYACLDNPNKVKRLISTGEQPLICIYEHDGRYYDYAMPDMRN